MSNPMFALMMPDNPNAPLQDKNSLTPQQKLAMALMDNSQQNINQKGDYSPLNGLSTMLSQGLAGWMMAPQKPAVQQAPAQPPIVYPNNQNGDQT